jgi:hypothetical protein
VLFACAGLGEFVGLPVAGTFGLALGAIFALGFASGGLAPASGFAGGLERTFGTPFSERPVTSPVGLTAVFATGLAPGLASGLARGFAPGLAAGLAGGFLASGLATGFALTFADPASGGAGFAPTARRFAGGPAICVWRFAESVDDS